MMYKDFEIELEDACKLAKKEFLEQYKEDMYLSAGGSKLESFINELQSKYEIITANYIKAKGLENDSSARKRLLSLTKQHARKCIEGFSKIQ